MDLQISTQIGNMFAAECNISRDKRLISIVITFSTYASTLDPERIDMTESARNIADPDTMGSISIPGYRANGFLTMNGM